MKRMHRSLLSGLALIAACGGAQAQTNANFDLTGEILQGTCEWSVADVDRTVVLDPIGILKLPASGGAGFVSFSLTLENCTPGLSSATFVFGGTPDAVDPLRYQNAGDAAGVAIELQSAEGRTLGANGDDSSRTVAIVGSRAVLDLRAGYWRLPGVAVGPGSVLSMAMVTTRYD